MGSGLLHPRVPIEKTSPLFRAVLRLPHFAAARRLMEEVFARFRDGDGNFIREFQTGGFSPRVFELALFAYLEEGGYELDRSRAIQDFLICEPHPVAIEATTTNPAQNTGTDTAPPVETLSALTHEYPAEAREFVFQAAKALRRKLLKRDSLGLAYWELPNIVGIPFVIAVEAFHNTESLSHTVSPLIEYLYGRRDQPMFEADGTLRLAAQAIREHRHAGRRIPSGLFALDEAIPLAAVLFSNTGTVSKFNRIGTELGYGPPDVTLIRYGFVADPDPNAIVPRRFAYIVSECDPDDRERFAEGLDLVHNPNAEVQIPAGALRNLTEHQLRHDGLVLTTGPTPPILTSKTLNFRGSGAAMLARKQLAELRRAGFEELW